MKASAILLMCLLLTVGLRAPSQSTDPVFRVDTNLVVLTFTVTDGKGHYVNGLKPSDFRILEDGIVQKIATFSEGNLPAMRVKPDGGLEPIVPVRAAAPAPGSSAIAPASRAESFADTLAGTNVFVLFDTSNYMYRGFVYASDAVADFVRGLDDADSVAIYTFSRNLSRATPLTRNRNEAIRGLRSAVVGDDAALYNGLLLTLRDASKAPGRKVVIVFSNGPDSASMVAPDDVRRVAEEEGIPLYVISTAEANQDKISTNVFRRIAERTGGQAYFARSWQKQVEAFEAIREDLGNSYTITYYPQANPNMDFRQITVELAPDPQGRKLKIRARPGYKPRPGS
ncbi:MAG: VWA domain-containing protein [Bryobacterales bacterium]|nr:VWA domain-containing protein [Bryobacterales bacterium]